ncbi:MAG: hypothetical protein QXL17_05640 [Candidatus Thermoplasmatota archaeon]
MEKKTTNHIIKFVAFLIIANLPFLTMTNILGFNGFIDSFINHTYYTYYKTDELGIKNRNTPYLIIQKATHPQFSINIGDTIFYIKNNGDLICSSVDNVQIEEIIERYHVINPEKNDELVYPSQILGKVVSTIDDNPWNSLSLKIWDLSINNLNAAALFINH